MLEQILTDALIRGNILHALLITGPEGSGLLSLARKAAAAYCLGVPDASLLITCPDYYELGAADETISVDDIRDLNDNTAVRSFSGGRRAYAILNAGKMTVSAQNAFLKTLEEAPENSLMILAGNENALLPTIRSRCFIWRVGARPEKEVSAGLIQSGVPTERANTAAAWADGLPELAARYALDPYAEFRAEAVRILESVLLNGALPLKASEGLLSTELFPDDKVSGGKKKKKQSKKSDEESAKGGDATRLKNKNADRLLDIWLSFFRDMLVQKEKGAHLMNPELAERTEKAAKLFTTAQILNMIETILEAQQNRSFNANPVHTVDMVLLTLVGEGRNNI